MKIQIAGLTVCIRNHYPEIEEYCKGYIIEDQNSEDFAVEVSAEDIDIETTKVPFLLPGGAEISCVYRSIGYLLPCYNGLIMHAVVMDVNGTGIALLADSGTGKTTLAGNILKEYGTKARIVNGDKPILRFMEGKLMAFGTPWNGKERYGFNGSVELKKLCFIRRSQENKIEKIGFREIPDLLFRQLLLPDNKEAAVKFFDLVEQILEVTDSYLLSCNEKQCAAVAAMEGMNIC